VFSNSIQAARDSETLSLTTKMDPIVYERPSAQGVEKSMSHKVAMSATITMQKRETSGLTDDIIDDVRRRLARGDKNVDVEKALKLTRKQVSSIKNGVVIKLSELANTTIAEKFLEDKKKRLNGEMDADLSASQKRRKLSPEKVIEILTYVFDNPIGYARLKKEAPERFGVTTVTVDIAKCLLKGKTRLVEKEFPVGHVTFARYTEMIDVIAARDYSTMRG